MKCSVIGRDTLDALGGHYVLNSGTFLGPSRLLVAYMGAMLEEFQQRWHCMRLHGSDQAVHNFLMYTGKFIGSGTCPHCKSARDVSVTDARFHSGFSAVLKSLLSFLCEDSVEQVYA